MSAEHFSKIEPYIEILKLKSSTVDVAVMLGVCGAVGQMDYRIGFALFAGILIHSACDIFNDIYDQDIDRICKPNSPIVSGRMSLRNAVVYMLVLYFIGITIAMALNKIIFICYVAEIIVGGILYSHPLFRFKDKPVIAIASVAICFSFEAVGMWSLYLDITKEAIIFAAYIFSLVFFLVFLKDFRDVKGDKNSLPVMFGVRKAAVLCSVMIFFPLPLLLHFSLIPALVFLISLIPCVYILLFRDPVALGSRLKDFMIFAIFAPNLSMFLF